MMGAVEYHVVEFPGNQFRGKIGRRPGESESTLRGARGMA
jgi:hypothetical protein